MSPTPVGGLLGSADPLDPRSGNLKRYGLEFVTTVRPVADVSTRTPVVAAGLPILRRGDVPRAGVAATLLSAVGATVTPVPATTVVPAMFDGVAVPAIPVAVALLTPVTPKLAPAATVFGRTGATTALAARPVPALTTAPSSPAPLTIAGTASEFTERLTVGAAP